MDNFSLSQFRVSSFPFVRIKLASLMKCLGVFLLLAVTSNSQTYVADNARDSARSDHRTGGVIEKGGFAAGERDIAITINSPAFTMTFWQNNKEIKSYPIGIGQKQFPIFIGLPKAKMIIWNPAWIPPHSDWVRPSLRGVVIGPKDPRNPLGKVKIPLGYGYLLHQAKGLQDMGNLVSHGCIRVLRSDIYDLSEKIIYARSLDFSASDIANAKRFKKTKVVEFDEPLTVEITYDTLVIESGILHIYPDVYARKTNTVEKLREEFGKNHFDVSAVSDRVFANMLAKAKLKTQFVISIADILKGKFAAGKTVPVLESVRRKKSVKKKRRE